MTEEEYVEFVGRTLVGLAAMEHPLQLGCLIYVALRVLSSHGRQCRIGAIATLIDELGLDPGAETIKIEGPIDPMMVN